MSSPIGSHDAVFSNPSDKFTREWPLANLAYLNEVRSDSASITQDDRNTYHAIQALVELVNELQSGPMYNPLFGTDQAGDVFDHLRGVVAIFVDRDGRTDWEIISLLSQYAKEFLDLFEHSCNENAHRQALRDQVTTLFRKLETDYKLERPGSEITYHFQDPGFEPPRIPVPDDDLRGWHDLMNALTDATEAYSLTERNDPTSLDHLDKENYSTLKTICELLKGMKGDWRYGTLLYAVMNDASTERIQHACEDLVRSGGHSNRRIRFAVWSASIMLTAKKRAQFVRGPPNETVDSIANTLENELFGAMKTKRPLGQQTDHDQANNNSHSATQSSPLVVRARDTRSANPNVLDRHRSRGPAPP